MPPETAHSLALNSLKLQIYAIIIPLIILNYLYISYLF
jgi:hypothetical protein